MYTDQEELMLRNKIAKLEEEIKKLKESPIPKKKMGNVPTIDYNSDIGRYIPTGESHFDLVEMNEQDIKNIISRVEDTISKLTKVRKIYAMSFSFSIHSRISLGRLLNLYGLPSSIIENLSARKRPKLVIRCCPSRTSIMPLSI